jgi:hypothetical protein
MKQRSRRSRRKIGRERREKNCLQRDDKKILDGRSEEMTTR